MYRRDSKVRAKERIAYVSVVLVVSLGVLGACSSDDDVDGGDVAPQDTAMEPDTSPDTEADDTSSRDLGPNRGACLSRPDIEQICRSGEASECRFVCDEVDTDTGTDAGMDGGEGD